MFLTVAALLASAQPAVQPAQPTVPAKPAKAKKICKADDAISGSRMAKRLCLAEEEWAERRTGVQTTARSGHSGKADEN